VAALFLYHCRPIYEALPRAPALPQNRHRPLTYKDAGVDVAAGEAFVERIRERTARTQGPEVIGGLGGFSGLFQLDPNAYRHPVLVATTDGVGTKLRLALDRNRHQGIGIDLVAMCVNDLLVCGARPLFFLDYLATGRLDPDRAETVVAGIAAGCETAGCALLGGETAEVPGFYAGTDYDLAGFAVGVAEREALIDGSRTRPGDVLIGLPSSGVHSNGFSLVRTILEEATPDWESAVGGTRLEDALLEPTRIYATAVRALLGAADVRALAHITGGGIPANLARVLAPGLGARLDRSAWPRPPVFEWLQTAGDVEPAEMLRTFNEGLGLVAVVSEEGAGPALQALEAVGEPGYRVGWLEADPEGRVRIDG